MKKKLVILVAAIAVALGVGFNAPVFAGSDHKYDGDCKGNETQGRCADSCEDKAANYKAGKSCESQVCKYDKKMDASDKDCVKHSPNSPASPPAPDKPEDDKKHDDKKDHDKSKDDKPKTDTPVASTPTVETPTVAPAVQTTTQTQAAPVEEVAPEVCMKSC